MRWFANATLLSRKNLSIGRGDIGTEPRDQLVPRQLPWDCANEMCSAPSRLYRRNVRSTEICYAERH